MDAARIVSSAVKWGLILGGSGFALGFFGPMVLAPGANQGPLLGIFITGPLGFLGGLLVGAIIGLVPRNEARADGMAEVFGQRDGNGTERDEDRWAA